MTWGFHQISSCSTPILLFYVILVYSEKHDSSIMGNEKTNFKIREAVLPSLQTDLGTKASTIFAKYNIIFAKT